MSMKRPIQPKFSNALRTLRRARGLAQEEFDQVSGRTYVSALERGVKHPTLSKVSELATVLDVHPLTLLTLSFCNRTTVDDAQKLLARVSAELDALHRAIKPESSA
jgi:transcriptional regulator with XRE-family HTH domain